MQKDSDGNNFINVTFTATSLEDPHKSATLTVKIILKEIDVYISDDSIRTRDVYGQALDPSRLTAGDMVSFQISIKNRGNIASKSVNVYLTVNDNVVDTYRVPSVPPLSTGLSSSAILNWRVDEGKYAVKINIETPDDSNTDNNEATVNINTVVQHVSTAASTGMDTMTIANIMGIVIVSIISYLFYRNGYIGKSSSGETKEEL